MSSSTFFPRLLICLYAAGLVALGAREIHQRYGQGSISASEREGLIKDLVGAHQIERGSFEVQKPPEQNIVSGEKNQLGELFGALTADTGWEAEPQKEQEKE